MNSLKKLLTISLLGLLLTGCSLMPSHNGQSEEPMDHSAMSHMTEITSEEQFLKEMIPHHQEAVKSSEQLLQLTKNEDLISFLNSVVSLQNAEIDTMKTWLKDWYGVTYQDAGTYMPMMSDLSKYQAADPVQVNEAEQTYIKEMINHHLGAVEMANQVLNIVSINPETVEFAQGIIDVQADEITLLQSWVKE